MVPISEIFSRLKSTEGSLTRRAFTASFWIFALRAAYEIFYLLRIVIIARILAPRDFGILGIALLVVGILETFSTTGFQDAIIQKEGHSKNELDTAWSLMVIRGLVLFLILFLGAPLAAKFFNEPNSISILRVVALSSVLQGVTHIGVVLFRKELAFYKQFLFQFVGVIIDFGVSVTLAVLLRSTWALVFGLIAGHFARCVMSFVLCPELPVFRLEREAFKSLFRFGKWVMGSTILLFLVLQGDGFFVGKFFGAAMLGFYQMATRISNTPATELTHVVSQVAFPAYSKIRNDIVRLREAYLKIVQMISFLSFPLAGLIFVLAPDFTRIFLGEKWMPMVPVLRILTFVGLARSLVATAAPVFYSLGLPKLDTKLQVLRLAVLAALIYPFSSSGGVEGTAFAVLVSILCSGAGFLILSSRLTGTAVRDYLKILIFPLAGTVLVVLMIQGMLSAGPVGLWKFLLFSGLGLLAYTALTYVWEKVSTYRISWILKEGLVFFKGSAG